MALTDGQKAIVAEITRKSFSRVSEVTLNAAVETRVIADTVLWETERNKLKIELDGGSDGLKFKTKALLNEIRIRVAKAFGFSIGDVAGVFAGGISKADKETRESDTDRVPSMFTADLHQQHSYDDLTNRSS